MATIKKRINITLPSDLTSSLYFLAKRDQLPPATKAAQLLKLALEVEEDDVFNQSATKRDQQKNTKFISHQKAWQ